MELVFLQIREQNIIEHIRSIADKVDEVNGDLKNTDPVLLWEEAGEDGEDIGGEVITPDRDCLNPTYVTRSRLTSSSVKLSGKVLVLPLKKW